MRVYDTFLVIIAIVLYIAIYCVQTFVAGIDPVSVQTAFGAACIVVISVTGYLTMEPKAFALYHAMKTVSGDDGKRQTFDDIAPGSNDREKLQNGTKQERLQICQNHLMLWHRMLAEVTNSELRSSHDNKDENRSGNKQSSHAAGKLVNRSNVASHGVQESRVQVNRSKTSEH